MKHFLLTLFISCMLSPAWAQYAPQAGVAGTTAIAAGSNQFIAWASQCHVQRGLLQITDPAGGYVVAGDSSLAVGIADGSIVSLGDSGVAVLTFNQPVVNGAGADFAVFENGFPNAANAEEAFLELAFVEVSSDGQHFFRFPATSLTQDSMQISSVVGANYMNARLLNNLAGKYISGYGTPFDLQELAGFPGLDINRITHVRIVDVIGAVQEHSCYDAANHKINDPYPTPFAGGGFDLDAVGVLHQGATGISTHAVALSMAVYPNPATDHIIIQRGDGWQGALDVVLTDMAGRRIVQQEMKAGTLYMPLTGVSTGLYYITARDKNGNKWVGRLSRQ